MNEGLETLLSSFVNVLNIQIKICAICKASARHFSHEKALNHEKG